MIKYIYRPVYKNEVSDKINNVFSEGIDSYSEVNSLVHKWDAYKQRVNYDAQKRHERYIRDRNAGKTGYLGAYNTGDGTKKPSFNTPKPYVPEPKEEKSSAKELKSKSSGTGRSSGSGGTGRSSGSGGSGGSGQSQADQEKIARIREAVAAIREASGETKARLRENAKESIEQLKDEIREKSDTVKERIAELKDEGALERENAKNQSDIDIEKAKDEATANIETDSEKLKKEWESKTDPIRNKISEIRAKLDSTSDPNEMVRFKRELLKYNNEINDENQNYTDSLFSMKTKHTNNMRNEILSIRTKLQEFLNSSTAKQKEEIAKQRSDLNDLRTKNNEEIKRIREQLKADLANETENAKQIISKIKSGDENAIDEYKPVDEGYVNLDSSSNKASKSGYVDISKTYKVDTNKTIKEIAAEEESYIKKTPSSSSSSSSSNANVSKIGYSNITKIYNANKNKSVDSVMTEEPESRSSRSSKTLGNSSKSKSGYTDITTTYNSNKNTVSELKRKKKK